MKVALTVWNDRISPVFDAARTLLIVELKDGEVVRRVHQPMLPEISSRLAGWLRELGVDVLICGAISRLPAIIVESSGVKLLSFIGGRVEDVLTSYVNGEVITSRFVLPGCGRHRGRLRGRGGVFERLDKEVNDMPGRDKTGPEGKGAGTGRGRGGCGGQGAGSTGSGRAGGKGRGAGQGRGNRGRG